MLDVDSKDPTVGISSPPKVFVYPEFLTKLASCIAPEGRNQPCAVQWDLNNRLVLYSNG